MTDHVCLIEGCHRPVKHPVSGLCGPCYSGLHYWKRKGVTKIVQRQQKLSILQNRMQHLSGNVAVFTTKKAKSKTRVKA